LGRNEIPEKKPLHKSNDANAFFFVPALCRSISFLYLSISRERIMDETTYGLSHPVQNLSDFQQKEHHVESFDATSFFILHDLDHDNKWYTQ
jgi:hypothetical protein